MSLEQFEEFYWPTLKKLMLRLIDVGLVPNLLIEGDYTSRLEIIKDVPKGKCIYHFERVDLHKAKKILGDRVCIRGSVPLGLMATGTPHQAPRPTKHAFSGVRFLFFFILTLPLIIVWEVPSRPQT